MSSPPWTVWGGLAYVFIIKLYSLMNPTRYQTDASRTAPTPDQNQAIKLRLLSADPDLLHAAMGICTEAGEFQDAIKKVVIYNAPLDRHNLEEELGDLMWYIALACNALNIKLSNVMNANIVKLRQRYPQAFSEADAVARKDKQHG